jgi:Zn finger protein HypA/HybF involved in hydrogenase expression
MKKIDEIIRRELNEEIEDMKCPDCGDKLGVGYAYGTKTPLLYCHKCHQTKYKLTIKRA